MVSISIAILISVVVAVVFGVFMAFVAFRFGINYRKKIAEAEIGNAEDYAQKILKSAQEEAETKKKQLVLDAKDEIHILREQAEQDLKSRRDELLLQEKRILQKDETLDRKVEQYEKKEEDLQSKMVQADKMLNEAELIKANQLSILEKISGMTKDQAIMQILTMFSNELEHEKAIRIVAVQKNFKERVAQKARDLLGLAISRCAGNYVTEVAVSVVSISSDEMKGRIIGREGRNIRAFENLTGVDLIIDDMPEAITLSCFDPVRREVARLALERLVADGRIHLAKIEEAVEKSKLEVEQSIKSEGEYAVMKANVSVIDSELVSLIGRLKYRTSYGQNILAHSLEVSAICSVLASELGVDAVIARRAGLLHDIGKALSHEVEGSHVQIGVEIAKKHNESEEIVHAIAAHHNDVEPKTTIACIVQAADAISAARPGARRENIESYVKRIEKLEEIANSFEGVESSYALQAGREIRIMVKPSVVSDDKMEIIAYEVAKQIEEMLNYPGQVKVSVVRESRVEKFAK